MKLNKNEYIINENCFEYNGHRFDCQHAIKRDKKLIIQEAEISHADTFNEYYDKESLIPKYIRLYVDENDNPVFGMITYTIFNKKEDYKRFACGSYYPFYEYSLMPHPYQTSICW